MTPNLRARLLKVRLPCQLNRVSLAFTTFRCELRACLSVVDHCEMRVLTRS